MVVNKDVRALTHVTGGGGDLASLPGPFEEGKNSLGTTVDVMALV